MNVETSGCHRGGAEVSDVTLCGWECSKILGTLKTTHPVTQCHVKMKS